LKVKEGSILLVVEARRAGIVDGVVDHIEVICVTDRLLLVNKQQAKMNRVSAKTPPMMVQMQSVSLRWPSSTGRLRNVNTFFLNIYLYDKFYLRAETKENCNRVSIDSKQYENPSITQVFG
jgi:hypothetical protein